MLYNALQKTAHVINLHKPSDSVFALMKEVKGWHYLLTIARSEKQTLWPSFTMKGTTKAY